MTARKPKVVKMWALMFKDEDGFMNSAYSLRSFALQKAKPYPHIKVVPVLVTPAPKRRSAKR